MKRQYAFAVLFCWSIAAAAAESPVLQVSGGQISGMVQDVSGTAVRAYLGVPFAAPPVGELRWRAPEPVRPWDGVRKCVEFPAACPQQADRMYANRFEKQSEDCLYLNVWTASATSEKRPVMVWIHGGGNIMGGTATPIYDGRRLAAAGVVMVSIQYRLGAFGYLAHPALTEESKTKFGRASSGNYGLMDQIAALRWVAANIDKFGGDPACVTVFGESAGAANITHLMASPLAKGLFHRAIAESGYFGERTAFLAKSAGRIRSGLDQGLDFAKRLGISGEEAKALEELRAASAEKILSVPMTIFGGIGGEGKMQLGPVVDGYVLPEQPREVWAAGRMHRVPLIAGSNLDDGSVFSLGNPIKQTLGYELATAMLFGVDGGRRIRELFPAATNGDVQKAVHRLITAMAFRAPARRLAAWMESAGGQSWLYLFSHNPGRGRAAEWGVFHGLEIPYVFGNSPSFGAAGGAVDAADRAVSDEMMRRWTAFAKFGDPNGGRTPEPAWPTYRKTDDRHLDFGAKPTVGQGLDRKACDLIDELSESRRPSR